MYPRVGIGDLCYNHCDSKLVYCDFSRVRFFLRLCATQKRYAATWCDPKKYAAVLGLKLGMLPLCATKVICTSQKRYVAILCDPKTVCCNTSAQPKTILRLCATQKRFVATLEEPCRYLQLMFRSNRPKLVFQPISIKKCARPKTLCSKKWLLAINFCGSDFVVAPKKAQVLFWDQV